jgi:hypothetical protein
MMALSFVNFISEMLDEYWAAKQPKVDPIRSTGLYAKAGTIVEVTVAKEHINQIKVIYSHNGK